MKNSNWKKRFLMLVLAMILLLAQAPPAVMAASLPNGWWPVWEAYQKAESGGSTDTLLKRGDDVIKFYSNKTLNTDIANQLYMVYYTRMNRNIFEDRGDYAAAKSNLSSLLSISEYLTAHGNDRNDMIKICKTRLELIDPQWGVYAVAYNQNNTYGSSVAAGSGTYYGAIFGSQNFSQKSITSFYVEMERETAQTYSGYISQRADGTRVILINLNFEKEGDTARAVPNGTYDSNIRTTFRYLNTLDSPVLVRIGGEMDVWTKTVKPADFIKAYRHVANIARKEAPKAELIWSPNSTSAWDVNTADFYPGDSYVDWVGLSLYYNYASEYGDSQTWVEYTRGQRFADPLRKVDKVYKIAEAHNKPVIATEGGATRNTKNDGSGETWTARVTAKEYSTLNMVYPRVKAIVHFDRAINGNDYSLSGAVYTAANNAMQANPALIQPGQKSAGTWVPIQKINETARDTLLIGAAGMTYKKSDMSAVYKLDNGSSVSTSGSPNHFKVDLSKMQKGSNHRLDVTLSDGNGYKVSKTYTIALLYNGKVRCFEGWRPTQFSDVKDGMYYVDPIKWAVKNEITNGTSETTFAPDATCTRGQVVTFLWRANGCPEPEMLKEKDPADTGNDSGDAPGNEPADEPADSGDIETPEIGTEPEDTPVDEPGDDGGQTIPTSNPFTDVKESDYFYKAVLWAVEQGITTGTSDTTFSPNAACTRGHVVTFLWRSAGEPEAASTAHSFKDIKSGDYYYNAVLWAVEKNITNGTTTTTFSPGQACTRGQVVTFLYRAQK
ncbi:MAG: S-layer homology domain-containing protein [Firmicutes bacterium]|nr:S-layer homology domain-containing protein [Bacillota bacterium]